MSLRKNYPNKEVRPSQISKTILKPKPSFFIHLMIHFYLWFADSTCSNKTKKTLHRCYKKDSPRLQYILPVTDP